MIWFVFNDHYIKMYHWLGGLEGMSVSFIFILRRMAGSLAFYFIFLDFLQYFPFIYSPNDYLLLFIYIFHLFYLKHLLYLDILHWLRLIFRFLILFSPALFDNLLLSLAFLKCLLTFLHLLCKYHSYSFILFI